MLFNRLLDGVAAVLGRLGRDQRGQGTVEYVGVVLLVGLLIGAVGGAITGQAKTLATTIGKKVETAINDVTGKTAPTTGNGDGK